MGWRRELLDANARNLHTLTTRHPEALRTLYRTFQIRRFGRYAVELMLDQVGRYESSTRNGESMPPKPQPRQKRLSRWPGRSAEIVAEQAPVDIVTTSVNDDTSDPAGSVSRLGLQEPYFFEAGSARELKRSHIKATTGEHAVGRSVLLAHGQQTSVGLGRSSYGMMEVLSSNMVGSHPNAVIQPEFADYFSPGGLAIFVACHTGAKGGLAERFTEVTGIDSVAPLGLVGEVAEGPDGIFSSMADIDGSSILGRPDKIQRVDLRTITADSLRT